MADFKIGDTIAAIATPIGEGGIAVIRVSGSDTFRIAGKIFRSPKTSSLQDLPTHTIHRGEIQNAQGEIIDQVLVSIFHKPHSYTGEDTVEISSHGGFVVTKRVLELLIQNGARHAEPGEFTKRAFLNGKIDLTQAEAVLDLIKAKSDKSLQVAVHQLKGFLSKKFSNLKDQLMLLYAHLEGYLDFPDEDLEVYSDKKIFENMDGLVNEIQQLIAGFKRGALIREGVRVAIVGKPNVGKSSLFNALLERDRALVSEFPGTTRDQLEEAIVIKGLLARLVDTAGIAASADHPLDRMGMAKTRQALQTSDLFLYVVDGSLPLDDADQLVFSEIPANKPSVILVNKCDLIAQVDRKQLQGFAGKKKVIPISAVTRQGLAELENEVARLILSETMEGAGEQITRLRHKNALEAALTAITRARQAFLEKSSLEFVVADLREGLDELKELIGEIYSEDLLDVIFKEFCIGK